MLDRLIKDIVTEEDAGLDMETFLPVLQELIFSLNTHVRQFIVGWVTVLDCVESCRFRSYLPLVLSGLFKILADPNLEIRRSCEACLDDFLRKIGTDEDSGMATMAKIVVDYSCSDDRLTKFVAVTWVRRFIGIDGGRAILQHTIECVGAILPSLSFSVDAKLRELATETNAALMGLIAGGDAEGALAPLVGGSLPPLLVAVTLQLLNESVATRLAALRWILMLHEKIPLKIYEHAEEFVPALLKSLSDPTDKVVKLDLEVLGRMSIAADDASEELKGHASSFLDRLVGDVLALFSTDRELLESRGAFIVCKLSEILNAETLFRKLGTILVQEDDLEFANLMVQNLSLILLTADEATDLRHRLRTLADDDARGLFELLYRAWCHTPVATFALCLLAQVYDHACDLLSKFSELEVTVGFLVEVDRLIQLLESPIFTYLRLQLLEPQRHAYLIKALYGLLMLLPQSSAYDTLKSRLDCLPTIISSLELLEGSGEMGQKGNIATKLDFAALLCAPRARRRRLNPHSPPAAAGATLTQRRPPTPQPSRPAIEADCPPQQRTRTIKTFEASVSNPPESPDQGRQPTPKPAIPGPSTRPIFRDPFSYRPTTNRLNGRKINSAFILQVQSFLLPTPRPIRHNRSQWVAAHPVPHAPLGRGLGMWWGAAGVCVCGVEPRLSRSAPRGHPPHAVPHPAAGTTQQHTQRWPMKKSQLSWWTTVPACARPGSPVTTPRAPCSRRSWAARGTRV